MWLQISYLYYDIIPHSILLFVNLNNNSLERRPLDHYTEGRVNQKRGLFNVEGRGGGGVKFMPLAGWACKLVYLFVFLSLEINVYS